MKRLFDILVSLIGILIALPFLLIIAIAIKLDSPGPILFCQPRVGRNRREFMVFKFRSMVDRKATQIDQKKETALQAGSDDRITRVGRIIRKTSLDELPQLFNVLMGQMSVVGPRPIIPDQLEVVPERFLARFDVPPGITGLAQVKGRRSLSWPKQLSYDVEYAKKNSIGLDLWICWRTVLVVLRSEGIYGDASANWRAYRDPAAWEREGC